MASSSTTNLPKGWKMVPSRRYPGKMYYYNVLTKKSSWDYPQVSHNTKMISENKDKIKLEKDYKRKNIFKKGKKSQMSLKSPNSKSLKLKKSINKRHHKDSFNDCSNDLSKIAKSLSNTHHKELTKDLSKTNKPSSKSQHKKFLKNCSKSLSKTKSSSDCKARQMLKEKILSENKINKNFDKTSTSKVKKKSVNFFSKNIDESLTTSQILFIKQIHDTNGNSENRSDTVNDKTQKDLTIKQEFCNVDKIHEINRNDIVNEKTQKNVRTKQESCHVNRIQEAKKVNALNEKAQKNLTFEREFYVNQIQEDNRENAKNEKIEKNIASKQKFHNIDKNMDYLNSLGSNKSTYENIKNIKKQKLDDNLENNMEERYSREEPNKINMERIATNRSLSPSNSLTVSDTFYNNDVDMIDISNNITLNDFKNIIEMEVDCITNYYIVLDTNVLLYELDYIDALKDIPMKGSALPHIFIPWIVFSELDTLKHKGKTISIQKAANEAIRYLFQLLNSKHPRIHGQNLLQAEEEKAINSDCNDDKILNYCLTLSKIGPFQKVILLTNDKNLSNKALVLNIIVHTPQSLLTILNNAKETTVESTKTEEKFILPPVKERDPSLVSKALKMDTILCEAKEFLKDVLVIFYEKQMKMAFEDTWKFVAIKPPYFLPKLLESILKCWQTVFGLILPNHTKKLFIFLQDKCASFQAYNDSKDANLEILTTIEDLLHQIILSSPDITIPLDKIITLKNEYKALIDDRPPDDYALTSTESECVFQLFDFIWKLINQYCGIIMDHFGIPHDFNYNKPDEIYSEMELKLLIINLLSSIHQLKEHMQKVLHSDKDNHFKFLHKALLSFVPSLKLKANLPPIEHFTYKTLKKFCLNPQNREMIDIGHKQLEHFSDKLKEVLPILSSQK